MATFKIGEVARFVRYKGANILTPSPYFDSDVKIDSLPRYGWQWVGDIGYSIITFDGTRMNVGIVCLRKIQPPPNWIKICRLDEVPAAPVSYELHHLIEFS
jgi:hypothetical protein